MVIYCVRHGETELGKNKIIATREEPLNNTGIQQAVDLGEKFRDILLDKVYCSPIQRAKDTLRLLNLECSIPVEIEERLIERDMGIFENVKFKDIDNWEYFCNYKYSDKYDCESMSDVYERVKEFLDELKQKDYESVLLVTHGFVLRAIYWYFNGIPCDGHSSDVNENCKIYKYWLE